MIVIELKEGVVHAASDCYSCASVWFCHGFHMDFAWFFFFPYEIHMAMALLWPCYAPGILASAADSCGWDSQVSPHLAAPGKHGCRGVNMERLTGK